MKVHPNVFDTVEDNLLFKLLSGPREVDLETRSFGENDYNYTQQGRLLSLLYMDKLWFVAHDELG
jgi:hypothetical protein